MNKNFVAFFVLASALSLPAFADDVQMPSAAAAPAATAPSTLPKKGESMAEVTKQFGEPETKHAPVGGGSPKQPPITRWDYAGFVVFFEGNRVIHAVALER